MAVRLKTEINNKLLKRKIIRIIFLLDPSLIKAAKRRVKFILEAKLPILLPELLQFESS